MTGGKSNTRRTPQGGVASPLLSVIYMNRFLKHWRLTGRGEVFHAHVISYADDFVILSRGHAEEALIWTRAVMTKLGLTLNEAKTSVKDARREGFDFLGRTHWDRATSPMEVLAGTGGEPVQEEAAWQRVKVKIGELLVPGNKGAWDEVRARLNRVLRGWSAYFSYGALASAYEAVDQHVYDRTRHFLRQRHKVQGRRPRPVLPRICLRGIGRPMPATRAQSVVAVGLAVKPVGKPDAGNPHVRFDERGRETGRCYRARPRLYR